MSGATDKANKALAEKRKKGLIVPSNPLKDGLRSPSLRKSINAHCYMCMGGEYDDPTVRTGVTRAIRECASEICPLRTVRPYQRLRQTGPPDHQIDDTTEVLSNG